MQCILPCMQGANLTGQKCVPEHNPQTSQPDLQADARHDDVCASRGQPETVPGHPQHSSAKLARQLCRTIPACMPVEHLGAAQPVAEAPALVESKFALCMLQLRLPSSDHARN